jgi:hypothetical protein
MNLCIECDGVDSIWHDEEMNVELNGVNKEDLLEQLINHIPLTEMLKAYGCDYTINIGN